MATALLVALPGAALRSVPPTADGSAPLGYPQRIAKPWRVGELPDRGKPLAGVAFGATDTITSSSGSGSWYAVAQDGGLSHLPVNRDFFDATVPALSADGRLLGYVDRGSGGYVIRASRSVPSRAPRVRPCCSCSASMAPCTRSLSPRESISADGSTTRRS